MKENNFLTKNSISSKTILQNWRRIKTFTDKDQENSLKANCFTRNTQGNLLFQKGITLDSFLFLPVHSMHRQGRPISFISKISLESIYMLFSIFHCHHVSKSLEFSFGLPHTLNGFPAYTHPPRPAHFSKTTRGVKNNWVILFNLKNLEWNPYYLP